MPSHQERVKRNYESECPPSVPSGVVVTGVVNSFIADVRTLLDYIERQYVDADLNIVLRRVRRAVDEL